MENLRFGGGAPVRALSSRNGGARQANGLNAPCKCPGNQALGRLATGPVNRHKAAAIISPSENGAATPASSSQPAQKIDLPPIHEDYSKASIKVPLTLVIDSLMFVIA